MTDYIQVLTTAETKKDAQTIATDLVEKRLAACAQIIGPLTSTYWWKGKVETADCGRLRRLFNYLDTARHA